MLNGHFFLEKQCCCISLFRYVFEMARRFVLSFGFSNCFSCKTFTFVLATQYCIGKKRFEVTFVIKGKIISRSISKAMQLAMMTLRSPMKENKLIHHKRLPKCLKFNKIIRQQIFNKAARINRSFKSKLALKTNILVARKRRKKN